MLQKTIESCGTITATCTLGAYLLNKLPEIAAILSVIWLSLNIIWFIWKRYKEFTKPKRRSRSKKR